MFHIIQVISLALQQSSVYSHPAILVKQRYKAWTDSYVNRLRMLTHWGRDKMAAIFQTTFSNVFSWMKMYEFRLIFPWSLFLAVQLTIFQHLFRQWLGTGQTTSHCLNQRWLVYWRIYASLSHNELIVHACSTKSKQSKNIFIGFTLYPIFRQPWVTLHFKGQHYSWRFCGKQPLISNYGLCFRCLPLEQLDWTAGQKD